MDLTTIAKDDKGKLHYTYVPPELLKAVAVVREYGVAKYHDPDNWKRVEPDRYIEACYRHWLKFIMDPCGNDAESGLPHLWHVVCNIAFLCSLLEDELDPDNNTI